MKKILFSLFATAALFAGHAMKAQTVLFEDSFETYTDFDIANVGNWTLIDVDLKTTYGFNGVTFPNTQVAKSFQVFNSTTTTPPLDPTAASNWTAKTGLKAMVCFAADSAPWNNDWLVSPQVLIPAGGGAKLSFWGKGCDATYGAEKFKVLVSTTGTAVGDFTAISGVTITPSDAAWHEYTYNLNAYAGQQIHVAIQCTSEDQFGFAVDDFKIISTVIPTVAPDCPTLSSPANAAVGVSAPVATLTWAAPVAGSAVDSYDVYLDQNANPTTLLGNANALTYNATGLLPSTTYYWKVVPRNDAGTATGCTVYSFTTKADPFAPYCGPLTYTSGVEPITSVDFGGMLNTSPAATTSPAHEVFTDKIATVEQGKPYTINLKGNTGGTYTNRFIVFIDWNQDGDFLDADETYFATGTGITINSSTGTDAKFATGSIAVPAGAMLGNTRMRIKKNFGTTAYPNPCFSAGTLATGSTAGYGQAEDYTVNVTAAPLGTANNAKSQMSVYPNPVKEVLNIAAADKKVSEVTFYSVDGKLVKSVKENVSTVNVSALPKGVYIVKVKTSDAEKSFKVIKD